MSFTAEDVAEAVENGKAKTFNKRLAESDKYPDRDGWSEVDGWDSLYEDTGSIEINDTVYDFKIVENIGGMDEGSYAALILEIDGRLFRKEGYYASHYGTDWDGTMEEVEAYEKTVTDYRPRLRQA